MSNSRYPYIIFFRHNKYASIDNFIKNNKDAFMCSFHITDDVNELNKLYNPNYHILITYGNYEEYHNSISQHIPSRLSYRWIHKDSILDIKEFNDNVNYCYISNVIDNRENTRPVFSIFTTCFKSYDYINTAYKSIKKQSLKDWEWVIMDDTPEDDHFIFLKKTLANDNRVRLYKRDKNSGNIGNVKNEVISLCRGKYILEMDHDDEILKDCLLDSFNIFESDPEVGFVYGDTIHLFRSGQNCKYTDELLCKGYGGYYSECINNNWVFVYNTPNVNNITLSHLTCLPNHPRIWKRSVLMELENYSEFLPICDDYEILLRTCCSKYKVVKNNKAQYIQYMNDEGNNFSTIRNAEINRIGPHYISPMFYEKYGVQDKMKNLDAYENPIYVNNQSDIWKRGSEYKHKRMNSIINTDYNKQYCVINDAIDNIRVKELYINSNNDFLVLSNKLTTYDLWDKLNSLGFYRMKCYGYKDCTEEELINYFKMKYKNDNCDYEIITNTTNYYNITNNNAILDLSSLNVNYFKNLFTNASPFKHIILDNIINEKLLNNALNEINNIPESELLSDYVLGIENVQINKFCYREFNKLNYISRIKDYFESDIFIDWLEKVTGIDNLQKDTTHNGAGIHIIKQNGKLAIHSDFNRHRSTMKYRRLNLLLYLNKDYEENYNGHLELWNKEMTVCEQKIAPLFNRIVLFKVDDDANHGHPEIWNSEKTNRTSLALYYYTDDRPEHEKSENYNAVWKRIQKPRCYIIHNNTVGGAYKFLTDTMKMYPKYEYTFIDSKQQLLSIQFNKSDLFILQNVLYTNIDINDLINVVNKYNFKLLIQIHDFQWLCQEQHQYTNDIPSAYLNNNINISQDITNLLLLADKVIMNSQFTYDIYSKYFDTSNFIVCYPSDYNTVLGIKNIPEIQIKCINIGVFSPLCKFKGERYMNYLKSKYECETIQFQIVGHNIPYYNENEFYDFIRKYNINGFLLLNEWGETYGYLLTKIINSGLPLLYNNFGAVKERLSGKQENMEHYFKVYDNEYNGDVNIDYTILESQFNKYIEYINTNNGKTQEMNENMTIKSRPVYNELFINHNYTLTPSTSNNNNNNTILIYTGVSDTLWNYTYLQSNPLGGSEKAVAFLGKELSSTYKVIICGDVMDEIVDNVEYVNESKIQLLLNTQTFHTIIISRYLCFFENYPFYSCKNLYVCSHDSHGLINRVWNNSPNDRSNINNILVKNNKNIAKIIALTKWHKNKLKNIYPSIQNKIEIINNGIKIEDFTFNTSKIPNKFIWSSCSDRGLYILLNMWKDILSAMPDATLDICSYHPFPTSNEDYKMNEIILSNKSITHHGKLNTQELYELMSKSEYWLYTNTIDESSCITALEMLMNEVICLYYPIAGLNDTLGNYGIPVNIGEEIESILNLTTEKKNILKKQGKEYALSCSWKNRADEWINTLEFTQKYIVDYYHYGTGINFLTYPKDNCIISDVISKNKVWEPHMHKIFEKYISKDSIVLEGGCHIGTHTLKLAILSKHVLAFEPMIKSNTILQKNLKINNITNVTVHNEGLSNKSDITYYEWIGYNNPGASGLTNNPMGKPNYENTNSDRYPIKLITIDSLQLDKLDFIKLDVEGYEINVIEGAINTIKKCNPIITIEAWEYLNGKYTYSLQNTVNKFKILIDNGYTIHHIEGPDFVCLPPTRPSNNILIQNIKNAARTVMGNNIYSELSYVNTLYKFVISFTPRGGCSSVFKAYLDSIGLLNDAELYHQFIHGYRTDILNPNINYIDINKLKQNNYTFIKFIMNPYIRAVSIFRIQNSHNLSFRQYLIELINNKINYFNDNDKFHYHQQYINGEEKYVNKYIKIDNNETYTYYHNGIKNILAPNKYTSYHYGYTKKISNNIFCGDIPKNTINNQLPTSYKYFYDDEIKMMVEKFYKDDIEKYSYDFNI